VAVRFEQALCRFVHTDHVFYMMTTRRALLKNFWGRGKRDRGMMSVSLYVVPSLYCAATGRSGLLRLLQLMVMSLLLLIVCCFWQNLFSHFDTTFCLCRSIWWLVLRFLKCSPLPTTSDRQLTRGEWIYTLPRCAGRSLTQTTLK